MSWFYFITFPAGSSAVKPASATAGLPGALIWRNDRTSLIHSLFTSCWIAAINHLIQILPFWHLKWWWCSRNESLEYPLTLLLLTVKALCVLCWSQKQQQRPDVKGGCNTPTDKRVATAAAYVLSTFFVMCQQNIPSRNTGLYWITGP